jgi:hypothetical protein
LESGCPAESVPQQYINISNVLYGVVCHERMWRADLVRDVVRLIALDAQVIDADGLDAWAQKR